jgi:hypothetical protein
MILFTTRNTSAVNSELLVTAPDVPSDDTVGRERYEKFNEKRDGQSGTVLQAQIVMIALQEGRKHPILRGYGVARMRDSTYMRRIA